MARNPKPIHLKSTAKNESGVNGFIPISLVMVERNKIENIPENAYPVAWAEGGNYVLVDERRNGEVYFWDHEQPETILKIADSFGGFLSMLKPFDIRTVELKPGQVKSVRINPEFLKRLKTNGGDK